MSVDIPLTTMHELNDAIKQIVVEFDEAGERSGRLMEAIGRPLGRSELRDEADDFEGKWDDKRDTLKGHLVKLQEQVEGVKKGWEELDTELAKHKDGE